MAALFAAQIYGDFSGYTDIARGLGKWMGFDFGINFNHPYTATSLRSFWGRWHISLSTWFRDYVYIPLGGSRRGVAWGVAAMTLTMLISGLWHGAAWTFVAWGALHAGFLTLERLTGVHERLGLSAVAPDTRRRTAGVGDVSSREHRPRADDHWHHARRAARRRPI